MKPVIGIIGLGIMGGAMAEALLSAGYKVIGFDVAKAPSSRLTKAGGRVLASSEEVARSADVLLSSLPSVDALEAVVEEIANADLSETHARILIETSTLPIQDKLRAQKRLKRLSIHVLDCPISGTAQRLKEGAWTIFVSGNRQSCREIAPVLAALTSKAPYVGALGNGSKMKFIANHLVAIYNVAAAESITFARKLGLDASQVWELFALSPVIYSSAMARGLGDADTASVCSVLEAMSGVPPK